MFSRRIGVAYKRSATRFTGSAQPRRFFGSAQTQPRQIWIIAPILIGCGTAMAALGNFPARNVHAEEPQEPSSDSSSTRSTIPLEISPVPHHDISKDNIQGAKREIIQVVGEEGINEAPGDLKAHSSTEWSVAQLEGSADMIVYPKSTEDVSEIMKICHRRRIPVTGFSGGTSLDGALASNRGGICIDFSKMNKILALHEGDMDIRVQPAVGWEDLNEFVGKQGLFFPPDPGPGAQIGGMIGTGCSGTNAYRYGPMKDWVISTTVVLADGTIVRTRNRPRKSTAGYDLTRLIVGSSGTLGLVTEAVLKLASKPVNEQVAVVSFPTTDKAVETVIDLVRKGIQIQAVELLDEKTMQAVNESGYTEKEYKERPTLFMKFAGSEPEVVTKEIGVVQTLAKKHGSVTFEQATDPDEVEGLWSARKTALWSLMAQKRNPDDKFLSCDVAVPMSKLALIIEETQEKFKKADLLGSTLGHVGDGNFHCTVLYSELEKKKAESIILETQRRGIELEGTITGEHGIGLALRDLLNEELGDDAVDMMRKIKFALDPLCLLNCDKIIRVEAGPKH